MIKSLVKSMIIIKTAEAAETILGYFVFDSTIY